MRVAVLGTGNMGRALIRGLQKSTAGPLSIVAWDASPAALEKLPSGIDVLPVSSWFATPPDVIILATKPADICTALQPLVDAARGANVLWCSIAAGITLARLESVLGRQKRICRVMPNTPALIGEGASAFALNDTCVPADGEIVRSILASCGTVVQVPEKSMNAVTGLSGSGPAFVYLFIEALIEGGVTAGLPYETARLLAVQTVRGAAGMVAQTSETPATLKAAVMSPGGTTARGLMALEQGNVKDSVIRAVVDATKRAEELGA